MDILLLGSGGREHALAWKLAQSRAIAAEGGVLWASPGNPGIGAHARLVALDHGDHAAVTQFSRNERIGLVVIGPEAPLVAGLADHLRAAGIAVFGPSRAAARLEGSKNFTKELCVRAGIPTARYATAASIVEGRAALDRFAAPYVLKADGLAAGKGVVIAGSRAEAEAALAEMLGGRFGAAGEAVLIEQFMTGEEASLFVLTDGEAILPFGTAQDHKRAFDGDTGPNTGGMGAYSPASVLTPQWRAEAMARIITPTIRQLAADGTPYSGVLYAGLMLTSQGPKLVEYNCRFGDPECQVLMMRFAGDLAETLLASAQGRLAAIKPPYFSKDVALSVVMAARGYPGEPTKGVAIGGIEEAESTGVRSLESTGAGAPESTGVKVFHAGTAAGPDGGLVTAGGRVLNVTAAGADIAEARTRAYNAVEAINFQGGFWRGDIGWREMERLQGVASRSETHPPDAGRPSREG